MSIEKHIKKLAQGVYLKVIKHTPNKSVDMILYTQVHRAQTEISCNFIIPNRYKWKHNLYSPYFFSSSVWVYLILFEDSLSVLLTSFSHKRPYIGGPTQATAYLTLSKNNVSEEIMLSIYGTQGINGIESYDTLDTDNYIFNLKSFNYDTSIELVVSKKIEKK